MTQHITVRAIIYKDHSLFLLKQIGRDGINNFWSTPGGHLEPGESIEQGLIREMIEETGVTPVIGSLLYVHQFRDKHDEEKLEFFFHVTNADDYVDIDLSTTTHGQQEISEYGFVTLKDNDVRPKFLQDDALAIAIESGSTQLKSYL
jgi:ADP-ribose pyrophosphatase YjhB (NUDIX family)